MDSYYYNELPSSFDDEFLMTFLDIILIVLAVALVPEEGMSFEMEKYMKRANPEFAFQVGRILELNEEHDAVKAMQLAIGTEPEKAEKYAKLLYSQACLMADLPIDDPVEYTRLVCELMN